ncbi:hypothetical protein DMUE_6047, partial [Dictyocoela muelleri]
ELFFFNRITKQKTVFIFTFIDHQLNIVKHKDMDILKYHNTLVKNIFISLSKLSYHPIGNLIVKSEIYFYYKTFHFAGIKYPTFPIETCEHINQNIESKFFLFIDCFNKIHIENENIDVYYAKGESIGHEYKEGSNKNSKLPDFRCFSENWKSLAKEIPNYEVFFITVREKNYDKMNEIYFLFTRNYGVYHSSDLPFYTDLHSKILKNISRHLICNNCIENPIN